MAIRGEWGAPTTAHRTTRQAHEGPILCHKGPSVELIGHSLKCLEFRAGADLGGVEGAAA